MTTKVLDFLMGLIILCFTIILLLTYIVDAQTWLVYRILPRAGNIDENI